MRKAVGLQQANTVCAPLTKESEHSQASVSFVDFLPVQRSPCLFHLTLPILIPSDDPSSAASQTCSVRHISSSDIVVICSLALNSMRKPSTRLDMPSQPLLETYSVHISDHVAWKQIQHLFRPTTSDYVAGGNKGLTPGLQLHILLSHVMAMNSLST